MVYIYTTKKRINQFEIGYMINTTLHGNKVFRKKSKMLKSYILSKYHGRYKSVMRKNNTCVISLIMLMRLKQNIQ